MSTPKRGGVVRRLVVVAQNEVEKGPLEKPEGWTGRGLVLVRLVDPSQGPPVGPRLGEEEWERAEVC